MKRRLRLTRPADFQRALGGGRVYSGRVLVAFGVPSPRATGRLGIAVSRQVRGAVSRNRAKRRLREACRRSAFGAGSPLLRGGKTFDMVLIARPGALTDPAPRIEAEVRAALERLGR